MVKQSHSDDRLELLLFDLGSKQRFGINVLKVKEIIPCPSLTHLPQAHVAVKGVAHLRGAPVTVIDLARAIGRGQVQQEGTCNGSIIITEFNRSMQGFLVRQVDRIVHCDWKKVLPPPVGTGLGSYITGVTDVDGELVQILDVEKVIGEVIEPVEATGEVQLAEGERAKLQGRRVMVVDDSMVARHQTANTLEPLGMECVMVRDGKEALQALQAQARDGKLVDMVLSDIEMPEMDGYSLTREIRNDPALQHLYVLLHTSLNGAINTEKAHKVGANDVLTKFVPVDLAHAVARAMRA
ncbi:chemotaxis protein [Sulfurivermis fontis]|uniref:chemotaxis protein n=1 Tax=Sulfurivermis fontis TaxID=1972068 RepID=UPI000FDB25C9|nr:chemotaxis protein [Sulfurivermis fontis]